MTDSRIMKDVLWSYPEKLTSVEVRTPPRCFSFEITSEPASGCGDRYTFQRSPVVSPAVRAADHKQGFPAESPASASWPRTPELCAEVFEDNTPTHPKSQRMMAREARANKRTKSQQGKGKWGWCLACRLPTGWLPSGSIGMLNGGLCKHG